MQPGEGAIEYAAEITAGLTREQAAITIHKMMTEPSADPRVKRCEVCGYPFRDKTRPGNAKVCGDTCKTTRKTAQKARQRKVKPARGVTVKANKPVRYVWWLEYPYWVTEKWMLNHVGSYERAYDPDKLVYSRAAKERAEMMGGRRKRYPNVNNL